MKRLFYTRALAVLALTMLLVAVPQRGTRLGASSVAAEPKDDYTKMPGYVDFDKLGIFDDVEATVEVFLKGPLLKLCVGALKHEEPELANLLSELKYIRVQVFTIEDMNVEGILSKTRSMSKHLEKKGWEIAVRMREDDEEVYIYMLPGENDNIDGLVVMVIEEDEEATFVNIVGSIDPEQIGRVGRYFDLDDLEDLDDVRRKYDEDQSRSRNRKDG